MLRQFKRNIRVLNFFISLHFGAEEVKWPSFLCVIWVPSLVHASFLFLGSPDTDVLRLLILQPI